VTTLSADTVELADYDNLLCELNRRGYTLGHDGELLTGDGYELEPWEVSELENDLCNFYGV
jgi:hypothetical protein